MTQILNPLATAGLDLVLVVGAFAPNGGSAVSQASISNGREFVSIARTGTGAFLIKFAEAYPQLVSKWVDVTANAAIDLKGQFGVYTQAAAGPPFVPPQIVLTLLAGATPTDMAANANNRVSFGFIFRKTTVQT